MIGWLLAHAPTLPFAVLFALLALTALMAALGAAAQWQLSDRARDGLQDLAEVMRRLGPQKRAAISMQLAQETLSRVLHPQQPNLLTRLFDLGPEMETEYIRMRAPKHGLAVVDARTADLLRLVDEQRRLMARMDEAAS